MKHLMRPAVLVVTIIFFFIYATAQGSEPRTVTTTLQVPVAGTVYVPMSDGSFDAVTLSGWIYVVTAIPDTSPPDPVVRVQVILDQVTGIGNLTNLKYTAEGSNRVNFLFYPPEPINFSFNLRAMSMMLQPVIFNNPVPLDISLLLNFNQDTGKLAQVIVDSMTVPVL